MLYTIDYAGFIGVNPGSEHCVSGDCGQHGLAGAIACIRRLCDQRAACEGFGRANLKD